MATRTIRLRERVMVTILLVYFLPRGPPLCQSMNSFSGTGDPWRAELGLLTKIVWLTGFGLYTSLLGLRFL